MPIEEDKMNKNVTISVVLLLISNFIACAQDTCSQVKKDAIIEYLNVNSIEDLMNQMLFEILKQIPNENREAFSKMWKSSFDVIELKEMMTQTMCKSFTIKEIKALTKFYGSPEGKSVMKKFPQYMAELMPYLQVINQRAMQKAMEELNKKQIEEMKKPKKS
jgi:hypothetical protein